MTTPDEFRDTLTNVNTVMLGDVHKLWSHSQGMSESQFKSFIVQTYPETVSPYIALSADMATDWYDRSAPDLTYQAIPADLPPVEQLEASASWALTTDTDWDKAFKLLAGSAQRAVFNGARNTVVFNASREKGARWARHASFNACRFCQMLATRGAVYHSEASAGGIVNRGDGSGTGKYHDHCHCIAVMIRPGQDYQPAPYIADWDKDYRRAVKDAGSTNTKAVMAAYREMDKAK